MADGIYCSIKFLNHSLVNWLQTLHLALGVAPLYGVIPTQISHWMFIRGALADGADVVAVGSRPDADLLPF